MLTATEKGWELVAIAGQMGPAKISARKSKRNFVSLFFMMMPSHVSLVSNNIINLVYLNWKSLSSIIGLFRVL